MRTEGRTPDHRAARRGPPHSPSRAWAVPTPSHCTHKPRAQRAGAPRGRPWRESAGAEPRSSGTERFPKGEKGRVHHHRPSCASSPSSRTFSRASGVHEQRTKTTERHRGRRRTSSVARQSCKLRGLSRTEQSRCRTARATSVGCRLHGRPRNSRESLPTKVGGRAVLPFAPLGNLSVPELRAPPCALPPRAPPWGACSRRSRFVRASRKRGDCPRSAWGTRGALPTGSVIRRTPLRTRCRLARS